jgi:hypothetical protein
MESVVFCVHVILSLEAASDLFYPLMI